MGLGVLSGCPACAGCLTQVPWAQRSLAGYCWGAGHMQLHQQGWGPWAGLPAALPVTHVTGHPSLAPVSGSNWAGATPSSQISLLLGPFMNPVLCPQRRVRTSVFKEGARGRATLLHPRTEGMKPCETVAGGARRDCSPWAGRGIPQAPFGEGLLPVSLQGRGPERSTEAGGGWGPAGRAHERAPNTPTCLRSQWVPARSKPRCFSLVGDQTQQATDSSGRCCGWGHRLS